MVMGFGFLFKLDDESLRDRAADEEQHDATESVDKRDDDETGADAHEFPDVELRLRIGSTDAADDTSGAHDTMELIAADTAEAMESEWSVIDRAYGTEAARIQHAGQPAPLITAKTAAKKKRLEKKLKRQGKLAVHSADSTSATAPPSSSDTKLSVKQRKSAKKYANQDEEERLLRTADIEHLRQLRPPADVERREKDEEKHSKSQASSDADDTDSSDAEPAADNDSAQATAAPEKHKAEVHQMPAVMAADEWEEDNLVESDEVQHYILPA